MDNRERILAAAASIYAQHGFRGATTRLIAQEAGVNEVTVFRLFGSKGQLFEELRQHQFGALPLVELPETPVDPEAEITRWCEETLGAMRSQRSILRKMISEVEENPEAAAAACGCSHCSAQELAKYLDRLRAAGYGDDSADIRTAVSMLVSALFGDAMVREIMPDRFPEPESDAGARYARVFMRAAGIGTKVKNARRSA